MIWVRYTIGKLKMYGLCQSLPDNKHRLEVVCVYFAAFAIELQRFEVEKLPNYHNQELEKRIKSKYSKI